MGKIKMNAKAVEGRARKDDKKKAGQAQEQARDDAAESATWEVGANKRGASRAEGAAAAADEKARKKAELKKLNADDEAATATVAKKKTSKKKKGKEVPEWEKALSEMGGKGKKKGAATTPAKDGGVSLREKARLAKEQEAATAAKHGITLAVDHMAGDEDGFSGRLNAPLDADDADAPPLPPSAAASASPAAAPRPVAPAIVASGLDNALKALDMDADLGTGGAGSAPQRKNGSVYKYFEEQMLPQVREDYPGLKLSQCKQKCFDLWKKSPDNPKNQAPPPAPANEA